MHKIISRSAGLAKRNLFRPSTFCFHYKSADWPSNQPFPLKPWEATKLAKMPTYYIMAAGLNMAETVAPFLPDDAGSDSCAWLSNSELQFYVNEFSRTGFRGGLQ